jgi:hypothetical protein
MKFFHGFGLMVLGLWFWAYGFGLWSCATSLQADAGALYHGLGAAPAADTLPVAAGSDLFLAAGSATFFFGGGGLGQLL